MTRPSTSVARRRPAKSTPTSTPSGRSTPDRSRTTPATPRRHSSTSSRSYRGSEAAARGALLRIRRVSSLVTRTAPRPGSGQHDRGRADDGDREDVTDDGPEQDRLLEQKRDEYQLERREPDVLRVESPDARRLARGEVDVYRPPERDDRAPPRGADPVGEVPEDQEGEVDHRDRGVGTEQAVDQRPVPRDQVREQRDEREHAEDDLDARSEQQSLVFRRRREAAVRLPESVHLDAADRRDEDGDRPRDDRVPQPVVPTEREDADLEDEELERDRERPRDSQPGNTADEALVHPRLAVVPTHSSASRSVAGVSSVGSPRRGRSIAFATATSNGVCSIGTRSRIRSSSTITVLRSPSTSDRAR